MINLDYQLHPTATELLLVLVDTAKQYQIQIIPCREVQVRHHLEKQDDKRFAPQQDPLGSLQKLGLVERLDNHNVRLQAAAFERASYERKNQLGKWWVKLTHRKRNGPV